MILNCDKCGRHIESSAGICYHCENAKVLTRGVDSLPNTTIASPPDTVTISRERYERLLEFEREENRRAEEEEKRRERHPGWKHVNKPGEKGPRFDGGGTMKVKGIECPKCKDRIWSRHRHDFRKCKCGAVFVDGGRDYLRRGTLTTCEMPKTVEIDTEAEAGE